MKTLIIGEGQIGQALYNVFSETYDETYIRDFIDSDDNILKETFDVIHVAFPYSEDFNKYVESYQKTFKPKYTIIHSTVPVGTSIKLNAIHSPVVGLHPNLTPSLTTFTKFLGGAKGSEVANYFRKAGIKVYLTDKPETTELMKISSTTYYALMIEYTKELKRLCDKHKVPFEMWTIWNENYNKGYNKLGHPEFVRPNLIPIMVKQGGHCTIPNLDFIGNEITELIKKLNQKN